MNEAISSAYMIIFCNLTMPDLFVYLLRSRNYDLFSSLFIAHMFSFRFVSSFSFSYNLSQTINWQSPVNPYVMRKDQPGQEEGDVTHSTPTLNKPILLVIPPEVQIKSSFTFLGAALQTRCASILFMT